MPRIVGGMYCRTLPHQLLCDRMIGQTDVVTSYQENSTSSALIAIDEGVMRTSTPLDYA